MTTDDHREADALMEAIAKGPSLSRSLLIAAAIHLILVAVLSVPYLLKAVSYGTLDVREAAKAEMMEADAAAWEKRISERQVAPEAEGDKPARKPLGAPKPETKSGTPQAPSKGEVSSERPSDSGLNIDEDFGL